MLRTDFSAVRSIIFKENILICRIYSGPPGCQKTRTMLRGMLEQPDLYLLAAPRTDLLEEHREWLCLEAQRRGIAVKVVTVHGKQELSDVPRRIEEACRALSSERHAILGVTHAALCAINLTPFTSGERSWHARIDEVPDALASGTFKAPAAAVHLEQTYDLSPSDAKGWWHATVKPGAPTRSALASDTLLSGLVAFDKRARSVQAGVLVDVGDWRDATLTGREVRWYSVWTPAALDAFSSVEIAGANFQSSLCRLASQRLDADRVTYVEHRLGTGPRPQQPQITVRYFTDGHQGSTAWWSQGIGKRCLNATVRYLEAVGDLGFYSGNQCVSTYCEGRLDHAVAVSPKQAGTNSLIHLTSCAMIYSNKAQNADTAIMVALAFTPAEIRRGRETEDLIQFVMRGAIRNPEFCGAYTIYLYDRAQAEAVSAYLSYSGFTDVRLEAVEEAGILEVQRPKPKSGQKAESTTDSESYEQRGQSRRIAEAERGRRRRSDAKALRQAEGTYRPRGRPPKGAS